MVAGEARVFGKLGPWTSGSGAIFKQFQAGFRGREPAGLPRIECQCGGQFGFGLGGRAGAGLPVSGIVCVKGAEFVIEPWVSGGNEIVVDIAANAADVAFRTCGLVPSGWCPTPHTPMRLWRKRAGISSRR